MTNDWIDFAKKSDQTVYDTGLTPVVDGEKRELGGKSPGLQPSSKKVFFLEKTFEPKLLQESYVLQK